MRIERYQSTRKRGLSGCGCGLILISNVVILTVIFAIIIPSLPAIGLRLAGFEAIQTNTSQATTEPIPEINNVQSASQVIISADSYGQRSISTSSAYTIQTGIDENSNSIAQVTIPENGISILCGQYTDVCTDSGNGLRNVSIDLQTGQATITGDAFISNLNTWQPISVLVSLTPDNRVQVEGVSINGTLFAIPDNEIGNRIRNIQTTANQAISQLAIQSNGDSYRLSDIAITETQLVATFR